MDNEQFANLRRLTEQATPGPWQTFVRSTDGIVNDMLGVDVEGPPDSMRGQYANLADAEFIVAARDAVPDLLDALAAMTQRSEQAEAKLATLLGADKPNRPATPTQMMRHWMLIASEQKRRADAAEHQLAAVPWDALHSVHMRAAGKDLHDWLTVTDWLSRHTPDHQEAQP